MSFPFLPMIQFEIDISFSKLLAAVIELQRADRKTDTLGIPLRFHLG